MRVLRIQGNNATQVNGGTSATEMIEVRPNGESSAKAEEYLMVDFPPPWRFSSLNCAVGQYNRNSRGSRTVEEPRRLWKIVATVQALTTDGTHKSLCTTTVY